MKLCMFDSLRMYASQDCFRELFVIVRREAVEE